MSAVLCRMAAIHPAYNKTMAREVIRRARKDGISLPAGRQDVLADQLLALRNQFATVRAERQKAAAPIRTRPLVERLAAHRAAKQQKTKDAVRAARKGLYRIATDAGKYAPKSGHTTTVKIGERAGVTSDVEKVWGKQWSSRASSHVYTVRANWLETVYANDLEVVGGMFTLDAEPIQGHGPELFKAVWVEQGRGCSLNEEHGYIARQGDTTYHAKTARAALDGVQRKAGLKPARRKGTVDLNRLVRRWGDLPVYWGDHEGIACDSGVRSWCAAVGIDLSGTTVADVVAGYRLRPHPEAIQVIRRVVRDRQNRQPIDLTIPPSSLESEGRVRFTAEGGFYIEPSDN